ncbi:MAG TPA: ribose-phosphate diphosphokinase [Acidimicrobiales bacterium]|nr:ribose-phosphate diphosphokinase [Acidimicrobiales bacterium]
MELVTKKKLQIVSGRANLPLAREIAGCLQVELGQANCADFANGEIHCRFGESVRGMDVFIIQSHGANGTMSINDALMEHLEMVDAARRASAKRITAVMPFYGYGRQDRKAEGREPITAKLVADMFAAAGADRLMSVDLHSGQIQGFFDGPFDHLVAMPVLVDYLRGTVGDDLVVVSPDAGRVKVAERYANVLHADLAIVHKRRVTGARNMVEAKEVVGNVAGRTCVLIDDMIDTGGTLVAAAEQLVGQGAARVVAAATHGVLSGPAVDRLKNSVIAKVVVTNTLPLPSEKQIDKIEVLSVAQVIADAIDAVFEDTSVSEIFGGNNLS